MNKNNFEKQLMLLIFFSFLCLMYLKILKPTKVEIFKFKQNGDMTKINHNINYNKEIKKSRVKKVNYNENFVETLLVSYALYYMSTDGVIKRPNIKNIAARACMSTTKLKKIFDKYDGDLFEINYYQIGQRTFTDSITLKKKLFNLISVKKNQRRIHQEYVTTMIKTKLPKGPLATLVFYITVAHSNAKGASTITMKKITGILSQKYEKKRTFKDEMQLIKIRSELTKMSEDISYGKISIKDARKKRNKILDEEVLILNKELEFRVIKTGPFNNALEENIRHAMRALIKNDVLIKKEKKVFFLNLNSVANNTKSSKDINIDNIEPGTTNNLSIKYRKETSLLINQFFFTKSQIRNKKNFTQFLKSRKRIKILLAKTVRYFDEKIYCKVRKRFAKNKWLMNKTFFCESLKERMKEKLREVVKFKYQFYNLSMYLSFFTFNQKIDLAILLFEKCMSFVAFKNMHEIKWDKFEFFNDLKKIYPPFLLRNKKKKNARQTFFATEEEKKMISL